MPVRRVCSSASQGNKPRTSCFRNGVLLARGRDPCAAGTLSHTQKTLRRIWSHPSRPERALSGTWGAKPATVLSHDAAFSRQCGFLNVVKNFAQMLRLPAKTCLPAWEREHLPLHKIRSFHNLPINLKSKSHCNHTILLKDVIKIMVNKTGISVFRRVNFATRLAFDG